MRVRILLGKGISLPSGVDKGEFWWELPCRTTTVREFLGDLLIAIDGGRRRPEDVCVSVLGAVCLQNSMTSIFQDNDVLELSLVAPCRVTEDVAEAHQEDAQPAMMDAKREQTAMIVGDLQARVQTLHPFPPIDQVQPDNKLKNGPSRSARRKAAKRKRKREEETAAQACAMKIHLAPISEDTKARKIFTALDTTSSEDACRTSSLEREAPPAMLLNTSAYRSALIDVGEVTQPAAIENGSDQTAGPKQTAVSYSTEPSLVTYSRLGPPRPPPSRSDLAQEASKVTTLALPETLNRKFSDGSKHAVDYSPTTQATSGLLKKPNPWRRGQMQSALGPILGLLRSTQDLEPQSA
jgi:hypothetical protein